MDRREREELFVRLVEGVEKLSIIPEDAEIQSLPPVCPSCGVFDPNVTLAYQEGGTGKMSEIVVNGVCQCGEPIYIVIDSYSTHKSIDTVEMEIKEKEKAGYFKRV